MLAFFKKHLAAILTGTAFNLPALWKGVVWLTDWLSRFDFWRTYGSELPGADVVIGYLLSPPPWTVFITSAVGVLIVLWDVRRKAKTPGAVTVEIALDPYRTLRLAFYSFCTAVGISVWVVAWPTMFPAKALPPATPPVSAPTPTPKPIPTPKLPWVTGEEIEDQRKLGRTLLIYSPQELVTLFDGGQDLSAYVRNWIKVDNTITSLPIPETIDRKEYYTVTVEPDAVTYYSVNRMKLYFDPKKWGGRLIGLRKSSKLKAICVFSGFNQQKPSQPLSYYVNTLIGSDCELP